MKTIYRKTQVGWLMLAIVAVFVAATNYSLFVIYRGEFAHPEARIVFLVGGGFTLLVALMFSTLKVTVTTEYVRASFGIGLVRFTYPLADIRSAKPVRNPWIAGWGIRMLPGIMILNVSGLKAVELSLNSRSRLIRIGTADPEGLTAAIRSAAEVRA